MTSPKAAQLGRGGSLALGAAIVAAWAFLAFTGRWFLFGASVALGVGMPLLSIGGPRQWERAMRAITGREAHAASVDHRNALTAAAALAVAAVVILAVAVLR